MTYILDTNIVIGLHRGQPREVYPSVWERLDELALSGAARLPKAALLELQATVDRDDPCAEWALGFPGFIHDESDSQVIRVLQITRAFPDWARVDRNAADPWVIAAAIELDAIVVTDERFAGPGVESRNQKIPNVAGTIAGGPTCIDWLGLARAEGWTF